MIAVSWTVPLFCSPIEVLFCIAGLLNCLVCVLLLMCLQITEARALTTTDRPGKLDSAGGV